MLQLSGGAVSDTTRHAVLGGGTRLRPVITLGVACIVRADMTLALRAAAAVELLHCASLVIDDLPCMDDEPIRRGQPSTHAAYGEPLAILSAIALVSLASRCIFELPCPRRYEASRVKFHSDLLSSIDCNGLIEGQALDLKLRDNACRVVRREVNELKTVPLFRSAVVAGFSFSEATDGDRIALIQFGSSFGRAYQLLDDLFDGDGGSFDEFTREMTHAQSCLSLVPGNTSLLESVMELLNVKANSYRHR